MRIKRFSAHDLPAVVAQIKEEFGLGAIILSQRATEGGGVEVTAGVRDEDLPGARPAAAESASDQAQNQADYLNDPEYLDRSSDEQIIDSGGDDRSSSFALALKDEDEKPEISAAALAEGVVPGLGSADPSPGGAAGAGPHSQPKAASPNLRARPLGPAPRRLRSAGVRINTGGQRAGDLEPAENVQSQELATSDVRAERGALTSAASAAAGSQTPSLPGGPASAVQKPVLTSVPPKAAPSGGTGTGVRPPGSGWPQGRSQLSSSAPRPMTPPAAGAAAYRRVQASQSSEFAGREVELLREQITENFGELKNLLMDLAHRQSLSEKWRDQPELVALYRKLLATGLSGDWARDFVEKAAESLLAWGGELSEHLRRTVKPLIRCLSPESQLPKVVAVTGPSGSGKTATLVRLAAYCQKRGQKVSAITLDTLKLGAAEQLSQYARIMGLGLKACQNCQQFEEALEIFEGSDVVLVDTNTRDFGGKTATDDLAKAVASAGGRFLLVLPVSLKSEDLSWFHEKLAGPDLLGLVLTKFDESRNVGNVLNFLASHGPSLAFFSAGPRTPEDFQPAKAERLIDFWLER